MRGGKDIIIFDIDYGKKKIISKKEEEDSLIVQKINEKMKWTDSTINSILLQQILNYCTPIIKEIPKVNVNIKDYQRKTETKAETSFSGINIIPDRNIDCILEKSSRKIKITKNQLIVVVGVKINTDIRSNNRISAYDYMAPKFDQKWPPLSKEQLYNIYSSGLHGLYNFYKDYAKQLNSKKKKDA